MSAKEGLSTQRSNKTKCVVNFETSKKIKKMIASCKQVLGIVDSINPKLPTFIPVYCRKIINYQVLRMLLNTKHLNILYIYINLVSLSQHYKVLQSKCWYFFFEFVSILLKFYKEKRGKRYHYLE